MGSYPELLLDAEGSPDATTCVLSSCWPGLRRPAEQEGGVQSGLRLNWRGVGSARRNAGVAKPEHGAFSMNDARPGGLRASGGIARW